MQYELNLRDYLRIFKKRKNIILLTFIIATVIGIFLSKIKKEEEPLYKAIATVKVEKRRIIGGFATETIINPGDIMSSETKFIKSFPILRNVAIKLNMIKEESKEEDINKAISQLQNMIDTERVENTNMIRIIAISKDPEKACQVANTVAESYIEYNIFEKTRQYKQEREFIEEQLLSLEKKLYQTEEKLKEFDESSKNIKIAEPIRQKLVELEFKLQELLQQFTEKHPKVIQLREQIKQIESQLNNFSDKELDYARLQREIEVNKNLYRLLKEKLEEARIKESQRVPDISIVTPATVPMRSINLPEVTSKNILIAPILGLFLGLVFAFIFETLDTSIGTIDDLERITNLVVLGVVPPILFDKGKSRLFLFFKKRFYKDQKSDIRKIALFSGFNPKSHQTEAFRNIYTNLKLKENKKIITITSSATGEGKTVISCNLSLTIAQTHLKTLLVCADLRKSTFDNIFGIKNKPGFSDLLMDLVDLKSAVKNITDIILGEIGFEDGLNIYGMDSLYILPSGSYVSNPVELFIDALKIKNLFTKIKEEFDVIILDAPPILPVADVSLIAPYTDTTILVYETGKVSRDALKRAKSQLEQVGAKIGGIVLNNTKPQTEPLEIYPYKIYKKAYQDTH